jgi:hypothetical protein
MANNSISLVSLDFDTLKSSLKQYLANTSLNPQFSDYNFDGANINVLLDILSYNSYLNAFYLNMAISEAFLDSAQLRNSVISRAKELNYIPRSAKSSTAIVNVTFPVNNRSSLTIPKQTIFTGKNSNNSFTYTVNNSVVMFPSGNYFYANNLYIYEGVYATDSFVVDNTIENQKFVLTNDGIDTDSLTVSVFENNGSLTTQFNQSASLLDLTSTSNVYFLQASQDTKYELIFGDNVLGRTPQNGAIVQANYRISSGSVADGSTNFTLDSDIGSISSVTVVSVGSGGGNAEGIESIRYNAPRHFQTQERAITAEDYRSLILANYSDIKNVHVYGGESVATGVNYGTVFVAPITNSGTLLSGTEKQDIELYLSKRCTIGINPKVIDPDFLYLNLVSTVFFDPNATTLSASAIQNLVTNAITNFNTSYLINFDTTFKYSRYETFVNSAEVSISSNETKVQIMKIVTPELNSPQYITVDYKNEITPGSIFSSSFMTNGKSYIFTDFNPNNNTFTINQNSDGVQIKNSSNILYIKDVSYPGYNSYISAGTIDYTNGKIELYQISINDFLSTKGIQFFSTPKNQDVVASKNDVILINIPDITINMQTV